jgi:poly-gamma-glutamate synthesis protein (capsule biosynthesis protein)
VVVLLAGAILAATPGFEAHVEPIGDALAARMSGPGGSHRPGCPVALADLRHVTVSHWGLDGTAHTGELVLHADAVDAVVRALEGAFAAAFPIERMALVESFAGDDDASMAANNTSAYNSRPIAGGSSWSQHAFGRAIDINPRINPYVTAARVRPPAGAAFLDRTARVAGLITADGPVVAAFAAAGWHWGGSWRSSKDYQHFSATGR